MRTSRTLIIGIDGATFDLLDPWLEAGDLPHICALIEGGVRGRLQAWPNTNSPAAWTSMVTGCNPGKHGVFGFGDDPRRIGDSWRPTTASDRHRDPFWCLLSNAGQRVGVINVPISYPVDSINGFMIGGMDAPSVESVGFARPPGLVAELRQAGIDYAIDVPDLGRLSRRDPERALRMAREVVEARGRAFLHFMATRPWDLFMGVFTTTDRMQHYFWPRGDETSSPAKLTAILQIYQLIDDFIGGALELIDADTNVVVVSDHGFGPYRAARHSLNRMFAVIGLLRYRPGGPSWRGRALAGLLSNGRKFIPAAMQRTLAAAFPNLRLRAVTEQRYAGFDWGRTRVFANNHGSRVYVNLSGREARGIVRPDDYRMLLKTTREILERLTDPDSGRPVVRRVWRREEIYDGPYQDRTADLFVEWEHRNLGERLRYGTGDEAVIVGGEIGPTGQAAKWSGEHRPDGILIARGPDIERGNQIVGATLYDVAPTILYCQGQPVPEDMDGRVLEEMFTAERLAATPVRSGSRLVAVERASERLSAADATAIQDRLRGLGYIE